MTTLFGLLMRMEIQKVDQYLLTMPLWQSGKNLNRMEINTTEFDEKCAVFLGGKYIRREELTYEPKGRWHIPAFPDAQQRYDLRFHFSWDWIMEVVNKIENLYSGSFQVDILQEGCRITKYCKDIIAICTVVSNPECKTKKEAVIFCIDKFLNYYSEIEKFERNGI